MDKSQHLILLFYCSIGFRQGPFVYSPFHQPATQATFHSCVKAFFHPFFVDLFVYSLYVGPILFFSFVFHVINSFSLNAPFFISHFTFFCHFSRDLSSRLYHIDRFLLFVLLFISFLILFLTSLQQCIMGATKIMTSTSRSRD